MPIYPGAIKEAKHVLRLAATHLQIHTDLMLSKISSLDSPKPFYFKDGMISTFHDISVLDSASDIKVSLARGCVYAANSYDEHDDTTLDSNLWNSGTSSNASITEDGQAVILSAHSVNEVLEEAWIETTKDYNTGSRAFHIAELRFQATFNSAGGVAGYKISVNSSSDSIKVFKREVTADDDLTAQIILMIDSGTCYVYENGKYVSEAYIGTLTEYFINFNAYANGSDVEARLMIDANRDLTSEVTQTAVITAQDVGSKVYNIVSYPKVECLPKIPEPQVVTEVSNNGTDWLPVDKYGVAITTLYSGTVAQTRYTVTSSTDSLITLEGFALQWNLGGED